MNSDVCEVCGKEVTGEYSGTCEDCGRTLCEDCGDVYLGVCGDCRDKARKVSA